MRGMRKAGLALLIVFGVLALPTLASAHKLKLQPAYRAAERAAEKLAGQPDVGVFKLARRNDHAISFEARWVRHYPDPPGICTGFVRVKFEPRDSRRITAITAGPYCY